MCAKVFWLSAMAGLFTASATLAGMTYHATAVIYQGNGAGTIIAGPPIVGTFTATPGPGPALDVPAHVLQQTAVLTYTVHGGAVQLGGTGAPITSNNASTAFQNIYGASPGFQSLVLAKRPSTSDSAAGTLAPGGGENGGFGGTLSLGSNVLLDNFIYLGVWEPFDVDLPQSVVGAGGASFYTLGSNLILTPAAVPFLTVRVTGQKWTTGTASGTSSLSGSSFQVQGTNMLTPGGGGRVTLVTPFVINLENGTSPQQRVGYATLTVVPEPGTLLLLGAGLVGLLGVERRRRRRAH